MIYPYIYIGFNEQLSSGTAVVRSGNYAKTSAAQTTPREGVLLPATASAADDVLARQLRGSLQSICVCDVWW